MTHCPRLLAVAAAVVALAPASAGDVPTTRARTQIPHRARSRTSRPQRTSRTPCAARASRHASRPNRLVLGVVADRDTCPGRWQLVDAVHGLGREGALYAPLRQDARVDCEGPRAVGSLRRSAPAGSRRSRARPARRRGRGVRDLGGAPRARAETPDHQSFRRRTSGSAVAATVILLVEGVFAITGWLQQALAACALLIAPGFAVLWLWPRELRRLPVAVPVVPIAGFVVTTILLVEPLGRRARARRRDDPRRPRRGRPRGAHRLPVRRRQAAGRAPPGRAPRAARAGRDHGPRRRAAGARDRRHPASRRQGLGRVPARTPRRSSASRRS